MDYAPINVKPAGVGEAGHRAGISEYLFVPVITNHFLGWGISAIFDLTFLPRRREFDSNVWENVKILPYAPPPPPPA